MCPSSLQIFLCNTTLAFAFSWLVSKSALHSDAYCSENGCVFFRRKKYILNSHISRQEEFELHYDRIDQAIYGGHLSVSKKPVRVGKRLLVDTLFVERFHLTSVMGNLKQAFQHNKKLFG